MEPNLAQNTPVIPEAPRPSTKGRLVLVGALVLLLLGIGIFTVAGKKKPPAPAPTEAPSLAVSGPTPSPTLMPHPKAGSYVLSTSDGQRRYPVNTRIHIVLTASSGGKSVVGYDVVLKYPLAGFAYTSAVSLLPDFQAYPKETAGYVSVSGVKSLTSSTSGVLEDTRLLQFEFTAAAPGTYTFSLAQRGSGTNKMVDDKAQTTYPQTSQLQLEIN